jgi:hypothetical protein
MRYTNDTLGQRASVFDSSNCTHVFVNFGQWAPAYTAGNEPLTPESYAQRLVVVAQHLEAEKTRFGNDHYWVTMNAFPTRRVLHGKGSDWRTDPMLLLYNKIATSIMHLHGIPVVDTYSIAAPLSDVSYDAAHYVGVVGQAQARMMLHILCMHS